MLHTLLQRPLHLNTLRPLINNPCLLIEPISKRHLSEIWKPPGGQPQLRPDSFSYFTGKPRYNDILIGLDQLTEKFQPGIQVKKSTTSQTIEGKQTLIPKPAEEESKTAATVVTKGWLSKEKMIEWLNFSLTTNQYRRIVMKLNHLEKFPYHPVVQSYLDKFKRKDLEWQDQVNDEETRVLDKFGRSFAIGRRKESTARVHLIKGDGNILINGKTLAQYFSRMSDRLRVIFPLEVSDTLKDYNAWCLVDGGGSSGQSGAIALGITRCLLVHQPDLKQLLRKAGCVTRDKRVVERKKTNQPKARKKNTWVKR